MRPKMVYFVGGNAETLINDYDKFKKNYAEKHKLLLKPFSRTISTIRSKLCPSHFKKDIKFQNTYEIKLYDATGNEL